MNSTYILTGVQLLVRIYCIKYIDSIFAVLCSVIDAQMTSQRGKNISDQLDVVSWATFFVITTLWRHLCIYNWTDNGKMESIC